MPDKQTLSSLIRASAGTGKTYRLSNQYIKLLIAGEKPGAILATTFTRKAAGEIRERIISRLLSAASSSKDAQELNRALDLSSQSDADYFQVLTNLINVQDTLRVYTLDSFFSSIAKAFAPELGLPENWDIIDEAEEEALVSRAVTQILNDAVDRNEHENIALLLQLLNAKKARSRVFEQLLSEINKLFHIYRTSTPDAWHSSKVPDKPPFNRDEIFSRIQQLDLPKTGKGAPNHWWVTALENTISYIDEGNWEKLLAQKLFTSILDGTLVFAKQPITSEIVSVLRPILDYGRYELLRAHYSKTLVAFEFLSRFDRAYREEQFDSGGIRYFDVEESLFRSSLTEEFEHIYYRLDSDISHLLLDEFQDTSAGQWNIIKPLADEITSRINEGRTFFCVGDIKQAIYGWRGGVREIFDVIEERYSNLAREDMQHSYRSSPEVIAFVNTIFETIAENPALREYREAALKWSEGFISHTTARDDLSGFVSVEAARLAEEGEKQEDLVLQRAADLVRDKFHENPQASIAVLVRTNSRIEMLLELLRMPERDIPASQEGGISLSSSPVVRLVLALLRFAEHPSDTLAHWQVRHSPLNSLLKLGKSAEAQAAEIRHAISDKGLGPQIAAWADLLDATLDQFERAKLAQLSELAYSFSAGKGQRLDNFIRKAEQKKVEDPSSNRVKIMTVHQAKGLEFDIVILPELDSQLLKVSPMFICDRESPTSQPSTVIRFPNEQLRSLYPEFANLVKADKIDKIQESLSLLYVALTRAAHCIHMVISPPKPDKVPCSLAGISLAAIEAAEVEYDLAASTIYSAGDANWSRTLPDPQRQLANKRSLPHPFSVAKNRSLDRLSRSTQPSEQEKQSTKFELFNADALRWGRVIHALFECLEWLDDEDIDRSKLEDAVRRESSTKTAPQPFINAFFSMLSQPLVSRVLQRSNYSDFGFEELTVHRELPFCLRIDGELNSGRIDRLVVGFKSGVPIFSEVIDFKTDVISESENEALADKQEEYRGQIDIYREVAARFTKLPLDAVSGRLLFVSADQELLISEKSAETK
jgi:ATP-dependent exoDNAse (exonuclease V) beta subunit